MGLALEWDNLPRYTLLHFHVPKKMVLLACLPSTPAYQTRLYFLAPAHFNGGEGKQGMGKGQCQDKKIYTYGQYITISMVAS